LTRIELGDGAAFDTRSHGFRLSKIPSGMPTVPTGIYRLITEKVGEGDIHYRVGHPLAEALIQRAKARNLSPTRVEFHYDRYDGKLSLVEQLRGQSGWLRLVCLSVSALETEDTLVFCGYSDSGEPIDREIGEKLMHVPATVGAAIAVPAEEDASLRRRLDGARAEVLSAAMNRNQRYYEAEMEKLEEWAEDLRRGLNWEIEELEVQVRDAKKQARLAPDLATKIGLQKQAGELERQRNAKRKNLFEEQDRIAERKDELLDQVAAKLSQQITETEVFTIRWTVV